MVCCRIGRLEGPGFLFESRKFSFLSSKRSLGIVDSFGKREPGGIEVVHVRNVFFCGGDS